MHKTIIGDVEITSDGVTVWVNGPKGCMARFGRAGYEVLDHVWAPVFGGSGWGLFTQSVSRRCGIAIPDSHKPKFLAAAEVE